LIRNKRQHMESQQLNSMQTSTQGRKATETTRLHRSLNYGSGQSQPLFCGFAPLRLCLILLLVGLSCISATAQEVEDTIRIKTRVVFLDALVKDKKTSLPISNLAQENFEVLDNGKTRPLSYFTREGQARKPLALVLILDLRDDGAGRFLKKPEIIKAMEEQLAKLPAGDEVAIMAMDIGEDEKRIWVSQFTNERSKVAAALAQVQSICASHTEESRERARDDKTAGGIQQAAKEIKATADPKDPATDPKAVVSTDVIKGKNGGTLTRTVRRDGSVDIKRTNKKGNVTIQMDDIYDMASAIQDASRQAHSLRPNSQLSIVWISDGIAPIFFEDRDAS
jgi:VWFA-related protein